MRAQASAASVVSSEGGGGPDLAELTPLEPAQPKQVTPTAEELEVAREAVRRRRSAEKVFETV